MRVRAPSAVYPPIAVTHAAAALAAILTGASASAQAAPLRFASTLHESVWQVQAGPTRCVLRHPVPEYGTVEFFQIPGQSLSFRLDVPTAPLEAHQAVLRSMPPPWNHRAEPANLGTHLLDLAGSIFDLQGDDARALLDALARGLNIEIGFGPVGAPAQAVLSLSAVRLQVALPDFQTCLAALETGAPATAKAVRRNAAVGYAVANAGAVGKRPVLGNIRKTEMVEDPYIRTDVVVVGPSTARASAPDDLVAAPPEPAAKPSRNAGSGLGLVEEVSLTYAPTQNELSDSARIELGSFAREYVAQRHRDVVLIAGSAADGQLTRRRALEIKGYLVRMGLPATHVLIHVPGERLPQRDGATVEPPGDATRMMIWRVR